ncbi:MAG: hypothetical protein E7635_02490 [Ruminococcaceae bacterium]|nr:hypothetical protein [Oscillospiraceae bacterium]
MKIKIKSALLCTALSFFALVMMRYGNDGAYLPASDYSESAEAVFFMLNDTDHGTPSAISFSAANNIIYIQSGQKEDILTYATESDIYSSASRVLPPVITPPETDVEVMGADS